MMIMGGNKCLKQNTTLRPKCILPETPHKLCNIRENYIIQHPRLPPNNAGRPMCRFKCLITWLKWRAGSPPVWFCFLVTGKPAWVMHKPWLRDFVLTERGNTSTYQAHFIGKIYQWKRTLSVKNGISEKHNGNTDNRHFDFLVMAWHQP